MSGWPLHRRLMLGFALFALFAMLLFGAYSVAFTYAVEDRFFENALSEEAAVQIEHHARTDRWLAPRARYMSVHDSPATFPPDLQASYLADPAREEHFGRQGRHYHVRAIGAHEGRPQAYLVAEVSERLVVRRMRDSMLRWLSASTLVAIAIALAAGYWLARRIAAPLSELADKLQTMRPDDSAVRLASATSTYEIGVLVNRLESLAQRVRDLVAREREFTRDASHELRTPLATIHSTCERLAADASLSDAARQQVEYLRQSAWRLQHTVATLLSLAREESSAEVPQAVALLPLLERIVLDQAVLLAGKSVAVSVEVSREARKTLSSAVLHILLSNLVANAFAHTASGQVRIDDDEGRLRVSNTSRMPEYLSESALEPFVKGQASSGYGLGLSIVRRLCERYDIDLRVEAREGWTVASFALDTGSI